VAYLGDIERLRQLALGTHRGEYGRTTGLLTDYDFDELREHGDHGHVRNYIRCCSTTARVHLGQEQAAELVHAHVCTGDFPIRRAWGPLASAAGLTGPPASGCAAWHVGASYRGSSDESRRRNHLTRADEYRAAYELAIQAVRRATTST
jgi:hypothetical protein